MLLQANLPVFNALKKQHMHTVTQVTENEKDVLSSMFGASSHQSSELELNQEDHMLTQAAHTVKICVLNPCWVLHLKWLLYLIWEGSVRTVTTSHTQPASHLFLRLTGLWAAVVLGKICGEEFDSRFYLQHLHWGAAPEQLLSLVLFS